jgi:hypothetical protein
MPLLSSAQLASLARLGHSNVSTLLASVETLLGRELSPSEQEDALNLILGAMEGMVECEGLTTWVNA